MKIVLLVIFSIIVTVLARRQKTCKAWADPHYKPAIGGGFNEQSAGDQILSKSPYFTIHIRTHHWSLGTTVITRVGVLIKNRYHSKRKIKVVFDKDMSKVLVNGVAYKVTDFRLAMKLAKHGAFLYKSGRAIIIRKGDDFVLVRVLFFKRGRHRFRHQNFYMDVIHKSYEFDKKVGLCVKGRDHNAKGIFAKYIPKHGYRAVSGKCFGTSVAAAKKKCAKMGYTFFRKQACIVDLCHRITAKEEGDIEKQAKKLNNLIKKLKNKRSHHARKHAHHVRKRNHHRGQLNHHKAQKIRLTLQKARLIKDLKNLGRQARAAKISMNNCKARRNRYRGKYNSAKASYTAKKAKYQRLLADINRTRSLYRSHSNLYNRYVSLYNHHLRLYNHHRGKVVHHISKRNQYMSKIRANRAHHRRLIARKNRRKVKVTKYVKRS